MKNKHVIAAVWVIIAAFSYLLTFHALSTWETAQTASRDASIALGAFAETSRWLSENLKPDEIALVPSPEVFSVLNPEMSNRLIDYKLIWRYAGVQLRERGNVRRVQAVRNYLSGFLQGNWSIRYVVRDWSELHVRALFDAKVTDELMFILREVKVAPFTLSTGWSSRMTVYEVVRYTTLLNVELTYPPTRYFMYPANGSVRFDLNGATIEKGSSQTGLYLPLEGRIDSSRQNYLTAQIQIEAENMALLLAFYFDKDGDGRFTTYEKDAATSIILDQTKLGWTRGHWNTIYQILPKSDYPIVQIGIVVPGEKSATIRLSGLVVYSEITTGDVLFEGADWLAENLQEGEFALVPSTVLYSIRQLDLSAKLMDYRLLWTSVGATLQANMTQVLDIRKSLIFSLAGNSSTKYVVRDWVNPYAERIFDAPANDELSFLLREVKALFLTISGGWSRTITIYEVVHYDNVLAIDFSSLSNRYVVYPTNASIQFDSSGVTIGKPSSEVRFYVLLDEGINTSTQGYFKMRIKPDVEPIETLVLWIAFYFDVDGNGKYDGPMTDYAEIVILDYTRLRWVKGEFVTTFQRLPSPKAVDDSAVQIGVIALGAGSGSITVSNLIVYT